MPELQQAVSRLYERLIERDLERASAEAREMARTQSPDELWLASARFAVLAYAPSQHGKRSVISCQAVDELREEGDRWVDLVIECALYAAESRQPWSEPPLLDAPEVDPSWRPGLPELREALDRRDRDAAERWIAARQHDGDDDLRSLARGDARLVTEAVLALSSRLGEKGRFALLRLAVWELFAQAEAGDEDEPAASLGELVNRAIAENGSIPAVRDVFIRVAMLGEPARPAAETPRLPSLEPYRLARDYGQTLIAHAVARHLPPDVNIRGFVEAVHENLNHGESYADWTFA